MKTKEKFHFFRILIFFLSCPLILLSQNEHLEIKKDRNWLIWNGEKHGIKSETISRLKQHPWNGFILKLQMNPASHELYNASEEGQDIPLAQWVDSLIYYTTHHHTHFALFFDVEEDGIDALHHLIDKTNTAINYKTQSDRNSLQTILKANAINWFALSNNKALPSTCYYADDYFKSYDVRDNTTNSKACKYGHQSSLLYHLMSPILLSNSSEQELRGLNLKHYWQKEFIRLWDIHGIQPSFLVMDGKADHIDYFVSLARTADVNTSCHGAVTQQDLPLKEVYWEHNHYQSTPGIVNFPLSKQKTLRPYSPGYYFLPSSLSLEQKDAYSFFHFEAQALDLSDDLELHLDFSSQDTTEYKNNNCHISYDNIRGKYLRVERGGEIILDDIADYKIADKSFTITFWLKNEHQGVCNILGSKDRIVRQGLHLQLRQQKPYFGFYINDLASEQILAPEQWQHLCFVYDSQTKERAIYIDGLKTEFEDDCPSFIGTGPLYLGSTLGDKTPEAFSIDELCIWSRALSANEILRLQMPETQLKTIEQKEEKSLSFVLVLLWALLTITLAYMAFRKQKNRTKAQPLEKKKVLRNAILLFGPFTIIDKQGKDISATMPPLLKELFLVLLIDQLKGNEGLSSEQLTSIFWSDLPSDKARNNRNVAFSKLRKFLSEVDGLEIVYSNKKHSLRLQEALFCDYHLARNIKEQAHEEQILATFQHLQRGSFLSGIERPYFDLMIEETKSDLVAQLLHLTKLPAFASNTSFKREVYHYILKMDDLNEEALHLLLKLLNDQNEVATSTRLYSKFALTYEQVYDSAYPLSLIEILETKSHA